MEHGNKDITRDFDDKKVIRDVFDLFVPEGLELCGVDMLVRVDEYDGKFLDCDECIFKDIDKIKYECCPYELVSKDNLLK